MRILVLGGYGLIGEAIVDRLLRDGQAIVGLGRDIGAVRLRRPNVDWRAADLSGLVTPEAWAQLLADVDAVVNAAGALQDGATDNLRVIHVDAVKALVAACERRGVRRLIQISAVGVAPDASAAFLRTKAEGDAAIAGSSLDWTIFRPGLVIAPAAYGGTALLRALASVPLVQPLVFAEQPVQTVAVTDVADAVVLAVKGQLPGRQIIDLVEEQPHSLADVVAAFRSWLGVPPAPVVLVPVWIGRIISFNADALGWLGWQSPFRSTAMRAVTDGVVGDPGPYRMLLDGRSLTSLDDTLSAMPSTVQERWFGRLWLLKPLIIIVLSLFWLVSGAIGLLRADDAAAVLTLRSINSGLASASVLIGSLADLALGLAVLVRPLVRAALLGMIGLTAFYLFSATIFTPDLWLDPLGTLVKTVPCAILALVGLAVLEER